MNVWRLLSGTFSQSVSFPGRGGERQQDAAAQRTLPTCLGPFAAGPCRADHAESQKDAGCFVFFSCIRACRVPGRQPGCCHDMRKTDNQCEATSDTVESTTTEPGPNIKSVCIQFFVDSFGPKKAEERAIFENHWSKRRHLVVLFRYQGRTLVSSGQIAMLEPGRILTCDPRGNSNSVSGIRSWLWGVGIDLRRG
ncbi:hypothetical protein LX32DRAFT_449637 [Colletotrichum zoysiae]|uniref:Uncharacterized protein n=1 Tax=Colletotrichum zoysiae TaxID=1216348 RepID=A0AAD9M026_9PEZI|nr:hypothetical protein LX32DRAFT_449637 [Colletotrichum zoysiae]